MKTKKYFLSGNLREEGEAYNIVFLTYRKYLPLEIVLKKHI